MILTYFAAEVAEVWAAGGPAVAGPQRQRADYSAATCRVIPGGVELPRAGLRFGRWVAVLRRPGQGRLRRGRRRPRAISTTSSPGERRSSGMPTPRCSRRSRAAAPRNDLRRPDRGRGSPRRGDRAAVPGCDQVRLVSSGTEAAMTAVRLAVAVTGRDRIVKFAGCYHGHSDALLAGGGSGVATLGLPGFGRRAPWRSSATWSCRTTRYRSSTSRWRA